VLIVYPYLPHYRYDVFNKLQNNPALKVEFAAARSSRDGSIVSIPPESLDQVHILHNVWLWRFLWQIGLLKLIFARRPEVIIFQGDFAHLSTWAGAVLGRLLGAGILYWTIGWHRPEKGLRRRYRLAFYWLADRLLIYGEVGRSIGVNMGFPWERMTVIYNSSSGPVKEKKKSDPEVLKRFAEALPETGQEVVTAVIRLNPVKRLDLLVEAAAILRTRGHPVALLLVGEGPERRRLAMLARSLDVPLSMPGAAYGDEELRLVYERTLVSVVPSLAGLTVLQSLKFGCPVITHDNMYEQVPECEAIVPDVTGDLYRYGDVEHLADMIEKWVVRRRMDRETTAHDCRAALQERWNADTQARIISSEIVDSARRRDHARPTMLPESWLERGRRGRRTGENLVGQ
jgi:glycosyltransferase involved in cell wall biosynthesis